MLRVIDINDAREGASILHHRRVTAEAVLAYMRFYLPLFIPCNAL